MRFLASALNARRPRFFGVCFAADVAAPATDPLGRPGPRRDDVASPDNRARACCNLAIWASISARIRLTSMNNNSSLNNYYRVSVREKNRQNRVEAYIDS